jgi:hypothetical protein
MAEKIKVLRQKFILLSKDSRFKFALPFIAAVLLTLWIVADRKPEAAPQEDVVTEIGVVIPKGFLIVPLQLSNEATMDSLVQRHAIVDLFLPGQRIALVENLRIMKLSAGVGPAFGALVPEQIAGRVQDVFSRPNLRAAIRTMNAGPAKFHFKSSSKQLLTEISTGEES